MKNYLQQQSNSTAAIQITMALATDILLWKSQKPKVEFSDMRNVLLCVVK